MKKPIDVVLVGTTKPERIKDTVNALNLHLSEDDVKYLEEVR